MPATVPRRVIRGFAVVCACIAGAAAQDESAPGDRPVVFAVQEVHPNLPELDDPPNLETPQACVENFVESSRREDYDRAVRSLNLRLIDDVDAQRARELARKLDYVLDQKSWIDWTLLPDRPDGLDPGSTVGGNGPLVGRPRRAIELDTIAVDGRDVSIYLQRVQAGEEDPVWLFSAHAVENIDALYAAYGPQWFENNLPEWATTRLWGRIPAWQWIALLVVLVVAAGGAWLATRLVERGVRALDLGPLGRVHEQVRWPVALAAFAMLTSTALKLLLSLPGPVSATLEALSMGLLVIAGCWLVVKAVTYVTDRLSRRLIERDDDTTPRARRFRTQLTIARHVATLLVALVGVSVFLIQIDAFRVIGIVLLTSAGAAALVLGLAGQAVIGNAIAGLQIAFTQPFRIGDSVVVEGNWGRIERITYTYVDVRTWDARRLVVPIRHFISRPIENWSKNDPFLIKPIYLRVDYATDVQRIRAHFDELVRADEDWAGEPDEPECLVTDSDDEALTVRLTAGGADSSAAWRMACRLREGMFAWLREVDGGRYLPRRRLQLTAAADDADVDGDPGDGLEARSRDELYALARKRAIPGRSEMNRAELIRALRADAAARPC